MAWTAVHPDSTTKVRLPEGAPEDEQAIFEVGFWPPRESERFKVLLDKIQKPLEDLDPITDQDKYLAAIGLGYERARDMVAFGVRGWDGITYQDGRPLAPGLERVTIDGREHKKLCDDSLHLLYVNNLLGVLSLKCFLYNILDEEQKKTSGLRLPSSSLTASTDASSVTTTGTAKAVPAEYSNTGTDG